MKGIFKLIKTILALAFLLVIALVIYVAANTIDNTNNMNQEIIHDNKPTNILLNEYLSNSLENTKENHKVSFLLSEYQLNSIIYSVLSKIDISDFHVKAVYSIFNSDGTILIEAPVGYQSISSCVKANVEISEDNGNIVIVVKNISIGKLSTDSFIVKNFILPNINIKNLEDSLKQDSIDISFDKTTYELTINITKDKISNLILSSMGEDYNSLFNVLLTEIVGKNEYLDFQFNENSKLGFELYLDDFISQYKSLYNMESKINDVKNKISTLLNNEVISINDASLLFDYLVRGYEAMKEENQTKISSLDLSSIGINDVTTYEGIISRSELTMATIFVSNIPNISDIAQIILDGSYDIDISEAKLNEILNSLDFIGTSFAFTSTHTNYIMIKSMYAEILDDKLNLHLIVDFNGCEISIDVDTSSNPIQGLQMSLNVQKINLGQLEMQESSKLDLLNFLHGMLKDSDIDYITINPEESTILLDFTNYLDEKYASLLEHLGNQKMILSSSDEGKIIIRLFKN